MLAAGAARAEPVVNISKSQQRLAVLVDGSEAYRWPVSTGRRGYATPSGTFHPLRLERHWYSHKYDNSPMPWSVFFYRGYAMHGTMEARHLGRPASHGCVRLRPDHAHTLFSLIRRVGYRHTRIVVFDGALPQPRRAPSDVPMAKASPAETAPAHPAGALAGALPQASEHLSAKAHPAAEAAAATVTRSPRARIEYSFSEGSDEARILRERAAWLRSIDRRFGIVR
jgi:hypothetical protein